MEIKNKTIKELVHALKTGEIKPAEVLEFYEKRIKEKNKKFGAFLNIDLSKAYERAKRLEKIPFNERGLLFGVPIAIKDNILVENEPCSCASKILEGFKAPYSATAIKKLLDAHAIPVGRANMDEFAMGSSNENSGYFPARNPWNIEYVPGGSSGGSAVSVAARLVPCALGSDTGGSIRQPASFCGVTGLKPTYGRVSRFGLVAFGSSLDQIGPITISAKDAGFLLYAIAGIDPNDSTSRPEEVPASLLELPAFDPKNLKVGVPKEFFEEGVEKDVADLVLKAIDDIKSLGAEIIELSLSLTTYAVPAYYLISTSEASSNLARYDGIHYGKREDRARDLNEVYKLTRGEGFGKEVKRRILLGTFCLSKGYYDAWYKKALQVRTLIREEYFKAFNNVDLIIGPTSPTKAFKLGERVSDPIKMYLSDSLTVGASLSGLPAVSIPCGFSEGLPVGLQIIGPPLSEVKILSLAAAYQEITDFHKKEPEV